jgi:hypothetical protein
VCDGQKGCVCDENCVIRSRVLCDGYKGVACVTG